MSSPVCMVLVATVTPFVGLRNESSGSWLRRQVSVPWRHILNVDHTISFIQMGHEWMYPAHTHTHIKKRWGGKKLNKVQLILVVVAAATDAVDVVTVYILRCFLSNEIFT